MWWKRLLLVLVGVGAVHLEGQETSVPARRLSIFVTGGVPLGGPSASVIDQLRETGYDDTSPGGCLFSWCLGPTRYPVHDRAAPVALVVRYDLSDGWAVSAGLGGGKAGSAQGFRADSLGGFIDSGEWRERPFWILAHRSLEERIHLGLGPSLHRFRRSESIGVGPFDSTRVGLTGEATVEIPRASRVFWVVSVRGHWIPGSEDVPPVTFGTLPRLRTSFSYLTLQTGVGLRL